MENNKGKARGNPSFKKKKQEEKSKKTIQKEQTLYKNFSRDNPMHLMAWRFIDEYPVDMAATKAAIRAGYSPKTAHAQASKLLSNPIIKEQIDIKLSDIAKKADVDTLYVLNKFKSIVETDSRKLSGIKIICCRYCWGVNNRYQFTPAEMERAFEKHNENEEKKQLLNAAYKTKPFDERGGNKYDGRKKPNPECPECFGNGVEKVYFGDVTELNAEEAFIFEGAEISKDGMKIKTISKDSAMDKLARYVGFYEKDNSVEITMPTDEELEAKFCKNQMASKAMQEAVIERKKNMKNGET